MHTQCYFRCRLLLVNDAYQKGPIFYFGRKWSETNEKSIFRFMLFLVFEIWSFKILMIVCIFFVPKDAQCSETDFLGYEFFLSFWDMVNFVLNIRSKLVWDLNKFRKYFMLGRLHSSWHIRLNIQDWNNICFVRSSFSKIQYFHAYFHAK